MKRRFGRTFAVGLLGFLVAVTPLSAMVSPGEYEIRFRTGVTTRSLGPANHGFTVRLVDRTGVARGLAVAPPRRGLLDAITNNGPDGRALVVRWEGSSCDYSTNLTFERTDAGFVILERTQEFGCFMGTGASHSVAIALWAPVDATTVRFIAD